jgi:hypothetical protein
MIVVASGLDVKPLLATDEIPAMGGGSIDLLAMSAMVAAGLAIGLGIDLDDIRTGLKRCGREYVVRQCSQNEVTFAQA